MGQAFEACDHWGVSSDVAPYRATVCSLSAQCALDGSEYDAKTGIRRSLAGRCLVANVFRNKCSFAAR